jgi:hypothetical protein
MPKFGFCFRKPASWILLTFLFFGLTCVSFADTGSATLSVHISDPSGASIVSAGVLVRNTDTSQEQRSNSNTSGTTTFPFLRPGHYAVLVTKDGFEKIAVDKITLNVGDDKLINLVLRVGSTSQSVTVDGSGLTINTTDASVSTIIDRTFVENMPLNGRSFQSLMTLAPGVAQVPPPSNVPVGNNVGVNGEIVVNGQRTEGNYFTVDGVSANSGMSVTQFGGGAGPAGAVAGNTALGSTQSLASIEDLQEFRATTSTYSAEYGRTPGGQFSLITRGGTEHFHGSAFDYLRNDVMDANNWFNDYYRYPKGKERQNDFGGTFGGPVQIPHIYSQQDKTFFFFSYEGLRLDTPQAATPTAVPDLALRNTSSSEIQPILNAFPIPNGGEDGLNDGFAYYIEAVSYPASLDNTSIRVDHSFSDKFKIFGRYANTPSDTTSYNAAIKETSRRSNHVFTLGSTNVLSTRQSNELRFNITQSDASTSFTSTALGGATPFALSSIPGPTGDGFPSQGAELYIAFDFGSFPTLTLENTPAYQRQLNLTDSYTWALAHHTIKFGIDWRRLGTTLVPLNPQEASIFTSSSQVLTNTPAETVVQSQASSTLEPVYTNFSSFVQDDWKVSDRLSLSLGLRWDINPAPHSGRGPSPYTVTQVNDLATTQLAPSGTPLWKTDWFGFAPRIGVAYKLRRDPTYTTVLRTGFGLFYDMGNTLGSQGYSGVGFGSSAIFLGAPFPLTSAQLALPPPSTAAPYNASVYGFDPNLKLPYSLQYNLALEQAIGTNQSVTINYVGSGGRRLLTSFSTEPAELGNPNFTPFGSLTVTQGRAASGYNSLQVKYQRGLGHGLQALASYTWSRAIDDASSNLGITKLLRADSDFDIRNNLQAAITYDLPKVAASKVGSYFSNGWGVDIRLEARSAVPVDILGPEIINPETGQYLTYQPNRVEGQPVYLRGNQYPGKRIINYNAFEAAPPGIQGDLSRNFARAFDAAQIDAALRRNFTLFDQVHLQFRGEAFNVSNHPNFGAIYNVLGYGPSYFGYSYSTLNGSLGGLNPLYQTGGPRSLQASLRLSF